MVISFFGIVRVTINVNFFSFCFIMFMLFWTMQKFV